MPRKQKYYMRRQAGVAFYGIYTTARDASHTPIRVASDMVKKRAREFLTAITFHDGLLHIAQELVTWEQDPDRYGGDLADLAQEARGIVDRIRKGVNP